ncbi:putative methyltransferase NSUN7 [Larimichthys crocea]|uniref:Putative methyltransferase NSUN7 n=1 Tax=Larimichthys crocea TaxID=215358 RepID=A0A6G0J8P9_LARCR|nr:putative methyltransferase NSUN7 [Larimichthys crocea]
MSCVAPMRRILNDKVGSGEDVNTSSATEEEILASSHEDQQTDKEPLSFLPPLPHLSSLPSTVPPPSDQAFLQAAAIFQQLRTEKSATKQRLYYGKKKTDTTQTETGDETPQRQAYHLAFNTLKYQELLEDMITDSCFHTSQHISSDLLPLAMVMLFDFQDRKFLWRKRSPEEGEERPQEVRDLESSLQNVDEVCEALQRAGVCEAKSMAELGESTFCRDPLCPDTLVFSQQLSALLCHGSLTTTHVLNTQDRSVCVAVSVLRPLVFERGDVLVAGSFSAMTTAHVAIVAAARSGRVLVCGADHTPSQIEEMKELLTQMDIKNVRVLSEAFLGLNEGDAAVQRLKVILVLPRCSSSALNDPVPAIHSEHGDWDLLSDLSQGSVSKNKIQTMATQQARLLTHSLSFPKVQTVVYCTRSVCPEENEQLVKRVLEKTHTHPKLLPFRINGPIFPDHSQSGDTSADSKFFRLETSQITNGCFIARLSRQADPTKVETVQDVLARAAAKGLLGGIMPEQSKPVKKGKSRKNRAASASSRPSSPSSQERQTERDAATPSEERKGECSEEEKEEDEEEKGGKKKRGPKGRKQKVKRQKTKHHPKGHKKKSTKKKVNHHLSPITAIAHKLSDSTTISTQQTVFGALSPACPAPPAASTSKQVRQNAPRAEKTPKDAAKPERPFKTRGQAVRPKTEGVTRVTQKPADFTLPPISFPSPSSLNSRGDSPLSQRPSRASNSQLTQMSASSSSVSLPAL